MPWWAPSSDELWKWAATLVCSAFVSAWGFGVWLHNQQKKQVAQDHDLRNELTGAPSIKTQLESLSQRVASIEHRMTDGETGMSDLSDHIQKCIGRIMTLEAQVVEINQARSWLFDRVTDLISRRR